MSNEKIDVNANSPSEQKAGRRLRADAQRSVDALLEAAKLVFAASGVDAPVREIAEKAGVGIGTVYRNFPHRADLIAAVFRREIDACAETATTLASQHTPVEALALWMQRYAAFIATKRGLASVLYSKDPAFEPLPLYFQQHLEPALQSLLTAAVKSGDVRSDIEPDELLRAVANLCVPTKDGSFANANRMIALLVDGLRYGAGQSSTV